MTIGDASMDDTPLKVGDTLYRVCLYGATPQIQSVQIVRVTPQGVWFGKSGGLAFDCRTRLDLTVALKTPRTPQDAVAEFLADLKQAAERATEEYEVAQRWAANRR